MLLQATRLLAGYGRSWPVEAFGTSYHQSSDGSRLHGSRVGDQPKGFYFVSDGDTNMQFPPRYATGEFEVTEERLGCYLPTEHIDNPKDYNDNKDARQVYGKLRPPVDPAELEIDQRTGMLVSYSVPSSHLEIS